MPHPKLSFIQVTFKIFPSTNIYKRFRYKNGWSKQFSSR